MGLFNEIVTIYQITRLPPPGRTTYTRRVVSGVSFQRVSSSSTSGNAVSPINDTVCRFPASLGVVPAKGDIIVPGEVSDTVTESTANAIIAKYADIGAFRVTETADCTNTALTMVGNYKASKGA